MTPFDSRNNSEKRNYLRVETDAPIELLYDGRTLTGTCKDLSATGLQVVSPVPLKLNAQVTICIKPSGKLPPFRAQATVARQVPAPDSTTTYGLVINEVIE